MIPPYQQYGLRARSSHADASSVSPQAMHLELQLADEAGLAWAQVQVRQHHYLKSRVDPRCSPLAYLVMREGECVGCLIFGRPECTRLLGFFGSLEDVAYGRCLLTRWQVLNLARVWLDPRLQYDPASASYGVWYERNAASWAIGQALRRVVYDYLVAHPPCFLDEPYEIREVISYCESAQHRGTLYRASNFRLMRTNARGLQTYARRTRNLAPEERRHIEALATWNLRSRQHRALRAVAHIQQSSFWSEMEVG